MAESIEDTIQKLYNTSSVAVFSFNKQIVISAASGDDAAEIWANRSDLRTIESLRDLETIIVYAGSRQYGLGFIDKQHTPTRISQVRRGDGFVV
jgi:hypothetical protein